MSPVLRAARRVGSKAKRESTLVSEIIDGIHRRADKDTKDWFTNYVKGTTWVGCKLPVVRLAVREACSSFTDASLLDSAVELLQEEECDVKLSGMLLLSEMMPIEELATQATLQRLEDEVLLRNHIEDWSSADWFATKVLRKIVFSGDHRLVHQVLDYTKRNNSDDLDYTFVRRCGVVSFLFYERNRDKLPTNFGCKLIEACERSLVMSHEQRFTQTGVAWVLRYVLLQEADSKQAMEMILRNGSLWSTEAKKSLVKKLNKNDPKRKEILLLGRK
jgi:hypothetical protein